MVRQKVSRQTSVVNILKRYYPWTGADDRAADPKEGP
jgi:hypothetical protein